MDTVQNTSGISGSKGASVNQAAAGMHEKIDRASEAARPAVDRAVSGAHDAVDSMADMASQAAETLDEKAAQFKDMQARFLENATGYVQAHPMASLGIAMAAGFLLSKMMGSSASSSHQSGL